MSLKTAGSCRTTVCLSGFELRQQSRETCRVEERLERDISRQHVHEARGFFAGLRDLPVSRNGGCRTLEACRLQCVFEDRHRPIAKPRQVGGQRAIETRSVAGKTARQRVGQQLRAQKRVGDPHSRKRIAVVCGVAHQRLPFAKALAIEIQQL